MLSQVESDVLNLTEYTHDVQFVNCVYKQALHPVLFEQTLKNRKKENSNFSGLLK